MTERMSAEDYRQRGGTPAARRKASYPEADMQIALVARLSGEKTGVPLLLPAVDMWYTKNEEKARREQRFRWKAMGGKSGVSDLLFLHGPLFGLELKANTNRPTPNQIEYGERLRAHGGAWGWANSEEKALAILAMWGLLIPWIASCLPADATEWAVQFYHQARGPVR